MTTSLRTDWLRRIVAVACFVLPALAAAQDRQDPAAIQLAVEQYLKSQTAGLPGAV
jgi:hypothetical protein